MIKVENEVIEVSGTKEEILDDLSNTLYQLLVDNSIKLSEFLIAVTVAINELEKDKVKGVENEGNTKENNI